MGNWLVEARGLEVVLNTSEVWTLGVVLDTSLHEALKPFSLTEPSEVNLMNSEFPVEFIGPMIMLEQNFPIRGDLRLLPSLMSTKSNPQAPEFSK